MRLSVTDMDSYRYWLDSDMEFDELLLRLSGQAEPTDQMLAGRAFHKLLETADGGEIYKAKVDGWEFIFAIDEAIALPAVRELKCEHVIQTSRGPVTLVGKVDALNGNAVHDYKLTERFEAERYADSYQWRCYLAMFGCPRFIYDAFAAKFNDDRTVWIHDYHRMEFHAYPGMHEDVQREVVGLAEIVAKHLPAKAAA